MHILQLLGEQLAAGGVMTQRADHAAAGRTRGARGNTRKADSNTVVHVGGGRMRGSKLDDSRLKNSVQGFDSKAFAKLHRIDAANVQDLYYPGKSAFSLPIYEAPADK
ncbi:hypothetical protein NK8_28410 [Caballeronia sp. NK8]|nr:hypothetical protein NK8_28410 [Caballeronia sp. NK8]